MRMDADGSKAKDDANINGGAAQAAEAGPGAQEADAVCRKQPAREDLRACGDQREHLDPDRPAAGVPAPGDHAALLARGRDAHAGGRVPDPLAGPVDPGGAVRGELDEPPGADQLPARAARRRPRLRALRRPPARLPGAHAGALRGPPIGVGRVPGAPRPPAGAAGGDVRPGEHHRGAGSGHLPGAGGPDQDAGRDLRDADGPGHDLADGPRVRRDVPGAGEPYPQQVWG